MPVSKPCTSALLLIMFHQLLNWRTMLALIAILIVSGTIWYSSYLASKIVKEERQKVEQWVEASTSLLNPNTTDTRLHLKIIQDNEDIPIIKTDGRDSVIDHLNLDSAHVHNDPGYLREKLAQFKNENDPIIYVDPLNGKKDKFYFGHSRLLTETRYFPLVQLVIVAFFIIITIMALHTSHRSTQNQVWAGMAKETAHQLGTPVSSLEGWMEILKETHAQEPFVVEIAKDVNRLRLVTDRFGKIGSKPQLEERDVVEQVKSMVDYMRKRASGKVSFQVHAGVDQMIPVKISAPLFDWVIENLLKNALDAMEGKGQIDVTFFEKSDEVMIDISDTGKGISKQHLTAVFKPGFTTKRRGWGLGLSLSKRIIEQYHKGSLFIKHSEPGKGTTFRIVLKK
jgi:signal transduction histidine kinase